MRVDYHLSQQQLADVIGISKSAVSMYERGERKPDYDTLELFADYFHVNIDYLIGRTSGQTGPDTLAAHFDGEEYTPEEITEILQFAEFVKNKRKH